MKNIYLALILISLFACRSATETPKTENTQESSEFSSNDTGELLAFNEAYSNFFWAMIDKKEHIINTFFHPEFGVCIIESNGAMPAFTLIKDIATYKSLVNGKSFFQFDPDKVGTEPVFGELPTVICDEQVYNKTGCFTQEVNLIGTSGLWNNPDVDEKLKKDLDALAADVKYTVINTANYTYYFSLVNNTW